MKNLTIISTIILSILLTGCAHFDGWNTRDKILFGTFTALHTVDLLQTREIMKDDNGYHECNPVLDGLGRDGATAAMVLAYPIVYMLANYIPKYRTPILIIVNAMSGICVINNHSIGVRIKF